jgi:uncharacterized RDD family membrane protein YckC
MAARQVQDHHLKVAPEVLGQPLGSPTRRALALLLDGLLLVVPTIAVALGAAALSLRASDRPAWDGLRVFLSARAADPAARQAALSSLAPLLVRLEAPGLPPAAALAVEEGRREEAAAVLATRDLEFSLRLDESSEPPLAPGHVRVPIEKLIPAGARAMALLGVPALYFSLLTALSGATLGKRLAGLRVRRLDGERLSLVESFERFTGYLHIPALLGWPVLDLWRDPNRQLPHDRTVHTVVVREPRRAPKPTPPPEVPAEDQAEEREA